VPAVLREFRDFVLRGNVVELAVAFVIGAAFTSVVNGFVSSFITPLIAAVGGKTDFGDLYFTISGARFKYGAFLDVLLSFLITAAVVFFLVVRPMNALMARAARREELASEAPSEEVALLTEIRDLLHSQRA
jgi:large conductance mechanosensitive channel